MGGIVGLNRPHRPPGTEVKRRHAVIHVVNPALGQTGLQSKVSRRVAERAVGRGSDPHSAQVGFCYGISGIEQADVARPRRGPADQPGEIAAVAHAIAGFGFRPDIGINCRRGIIGIEPDGGIGLAATDLGKAAADHDVAIGQNLRSGNKRPGVRVGSGLIGIGPLPVVEFAMEAGKLVVGGVEEGRIDSAVGVKPGKAQPMGAVKHGEEAADIHAAVRLGADVIDGVIGAGACS